MKTLRFGVLTAASTFIALSVCAQEHKVERSALPPAVDRTVETETHGATITGFATERENGKKVYEAQTTVDGHTRDLQIAEDGKLNEIEEEVAFNALPAKVQAALKAKAGSARITKTESLTKGGKLVAYESATLRGTHKGEIQVGPEGDKLKHAE